MNVIIPFIDRDAQRCQQLLDWISWLGASNDLFLYLLCREEWLGLVSSPIVFKHIPDYQQIDTRWQQVGPEDIDKQGDATGANSMWKQAAKFAKLNEIGPWLYLEPDSMPTRRDWSQALSFEYHKGNQPFMGADVPAYGRRKRRMSGVAIYPQDVATLAQAPFMATHEAFDTAGAEQFLAHAHLTDLFKYEWRGVPFTSQADLDLRVPPQTAIFHGCSDGSIYQFLTKRIAPETSLPQATPALQILQDHIIKHGASDLPTKADLTPGEVPHQNLVRKPITPDQMPVPFAISTLAAECLKGGLNKARVVKDLIAAGIFPAPERPAKKKRRLPKLKVVSK